MKKRWLLLSVLLISLLLVLCSCSVIDKKALQKEQYLDQVETSKLGDLEGYTYTSDNDGLVLLSKVEDVESAEVSVKVLNIDSGEIVYSATIGEDDSVFLENGFVIRSRQNDDKTTYTVVNRDKTVLCTGVKSYLLVNDCLVYDEVNVIRFDKDYKAIDSYTRGTFDGSIPDCDDYTEKYYYDTKDDTVVIYDKHYQMTAVYKAPSYLTNPKFFVFDDGYVICQALEYLDDETTDYDVLKGGSKYDLFTVRINPSNGNTKELKADFILQEVIRTEELEDDNIFVSSVKNIAVVYPIENQRILSDSEEFCLMSLNSRLQGNELWNIQGETAICSPIGNGYLVSMGVITGNSYLLSSNMKVLANLSAVEEWTSKYFVMENGIYNFDLEKLEDLTDKDYEYVDNVGNTLIFRGKAKNANTGLDEDAYYRYDGSFTKIASGEEWGGVDSSIYKTWYCVEKTGSSGTEYRYYDATGKLLFTSYGSSATRLAKGDQYALMRVTLSDGKSAFYRMQVEK